MGDPEKPPPVTVHGGSTGSSTTSGYSVNYDSATGAVTKAETEITELTSAGESITTAFTTAEGALPPEFETAKARLSALSEGHVTAVTTVKTYADGCVASARTCLSAYENASAEQVAESARYQSKIDFDHPGLFGQTEAAINDYADKKTKPLNDKLPSKEMPKKFGNGYEYTDSGGPASHEVKTSHSSTRHYVTDEHTTTHYDGQKGNFSHQGTQTTHKVSGPGSSTTTSSYEGWSRTATTQVDVTSHQTEIQVGKQDPVTIQRGSVRSRPIP